jgi:hypothetical protein
VSLFSCPLTLSERYSLAWQLTWPLTLIDIGIAFIIHVILDIHKPGAELVSEIPNLLIIAPWIIRLMMRRSYPGFRLKTLVDGAPAQMGYTESFKVMWLLSWRTEMLMLVLLLVVSFFLRFVNVQLSSLVPSTEESPFLSALGLSLVLNAAALILMPFVIPGMFSKKYQGFRIVAERITAQPPVPAAPAKKPKK